MGHSNQDVFPIALSLPKEIPLVASDRTEQPEDRVLHGGGAIGRRFRILGVEPHGWSTVLIEDEGGRAYVVTSATGRLTEIAAADALDLIDRRTYRPWRGNRDWSDLDHLPLIATARQRPHPPTTDTAEGDAAFP
jgi:hypothetical protein